jgi:CheY-like chemotaxis protein
VDPEQLRAMGFAGHMTKPVRQSQLFDAIMSAIAAEQTALPASPAASPSRRLSPSRQPTSADASGPRILLAEDNEVNQIVAREVLRKAGYRCDAVSDGGSAIEAVRAQRYDLVLMDCHMPGVDGFQATRQIRLDERAARAADPGLSPLPIVALTANAMKGDRELCLAAGMDAYASKPIDPARLLETIATLLGRTAAERAVPAAAA